ncbi:MAG: hypothetical protein WBC60_11870 [Cognaticolwellia sp.]
MSDVIIFTPKFKLGADKNVKNFITFSESLPLLNDEMEFDSYTWKGICTFTKLGTTAGNRDKANHLDISIVPFAKAYLIYNQTQNRTKNVHEIKALRAIEAAMLKSHGTVILTKINSAVLDNAAQIARENYGIRVAYQAGSHLQKLQEFLMKKCMIPQFTWKNPNKRAPDTVERVGKKGTENREKKLPDEDALLAISEIFSLDESNLSNLDIFTSSSIALLLCAPARGSELFYLKTDCLHYSKDSKGNQVVGLMWYSGKGFGYEVEWIPEVMVPVAEKAVMRLKKLSQSSREWACKMEVLMDAVNSNEAHTFPRHALCPDVPSDTTLLNLVQTANALGYNTNPNTSIDSHSNTTGARAFLIKRGIKVKGWKQNDKKYCLQDLIPKLIELLPKGFPYIKYSVGEHVKVKWSQALFCSNTYAYAHKGKKMITTELWRAVLGTLNEDLSTTKKKNLSTEKSVNVLSIFERHNYLSSYVITSHQLRHMISTIAKVNGMKEHVLTKWAGRADGKHNRVYNHTTPEQYKEKALLIQPRKSIGDLGLNEYEICEPETLQEINTGSTQTAHVTEFGACIHDYIMSPCSKHRDCINCEEQVCVKGDEIKLERLKKRFEREMILIEGDKNAMGNGLLNADRHYHKRLVTICRCEELIRILSDDNVPDGSVVKLSISNESHLDMVMDKNHKKRLPKIEKHKKEQPVVSVKKPRALRFYKRNKVE